jgi:hypothetical protein
LPTSTEANAKAKPGRRGMETTHRVIKPHQVEGIKGAFMWAHRDHSRRVGAEEGEWSLILACGQCSSLQSIEVDNEARRQAYTAKLKETGAVVF